MANQRTKKRFTTDYEFRVRCCGHYHNVFISKNGHISFPEHDLKEFDGEAIITALGGRAIRCAEILKLWRTGRCYRLPYRMSQLRSYTPSCLTRRQFIKTLKGQRFKYGYGYKYYYPWYARSKGFVENRPSGPLTILERKCELARSYLERCDYRKSTNTIPGKLDGSLCGKIVIKVAPSELLNERREKYYYLFKDFRTIANDIITTSLKTEGSIETSMGLAYNIHTMTRGVRMPIVCLLLPEGWFENVARKKLAVVDGKFVMKVYDQKIDDQQVVSALYQGNGYKLTIRTALITKKGKLKWVDNVSPSSSTTAIYPIPVLNTDTIECSQNQSQVLPQTGTSNEMPGLNIQPSPVTLITACNKL